MNNYICKIANIDEVISKMEYEVSKHPGDMRWKIWKDEAEKFLKEEKRICYIGMLDDIIICEATAAISKDAAQNTEGLINNDIAYLFAFRTNEEYRGKGFFSKLYRFMENDLIKRGYTKFTLGVEPKEAKNLEIYKHLGFTKYIKRDYEEEPPINSESEPEKVLVEYYMKEI